MSASPIARLTKSSCPEHVIYLTDKGIEIPSIAKTNGSPIAAAELAKLYQLEYGYAFVAEFGGSVEKIPCVKMFAEAMKSSADAFDYKGEYEKCKQQNEDLVSWRDEHKEKYEKIADAIGRLFSSVGQTLCTAEHERKYYRAVDNALGVAGTVKDSIEAANGYLDSAMGNISDEDSDAAESNIRLASYEMTNASPDKVAEHVESLVDLANLYNNCLRETVESLDQIIREKL